MARPPQAGCCCPQATREQVGFSLLGPSLRHPSLPVPHVRPVLRPVSRVSLPLTGTALPPPGSNSGPSPQPELTLGLRAPPTLLSTSSGGKSAVTHVSSPGTVTRLGSVTHVTTFSHASPGNRGGYNFKVSLSPHSTSFRRPHLSPPAETTAWGCRARRLSPPRSSTTMCTEQPRPEKERRCQWSTGSRGHG